MTRMIQAIHVFAVILTGIALAPALAHAFEFPGKKRLDRNAYIMTQGIYYPGFTLLGMFEPAALFATAAMLFTERQQHPISAWLTLVALIGLTGVQVIYWFVTHRINRFWIRNSATPTGKAGGTFFAVTAAAQSRPESWQALRDRWEYSHVVRAALIFLSFVALTTAMAT